MENESSSCLDRYHASRRNPWNEVEYGDHYARAMASYGVFLAACGYEYHGPKAHLGFAPNISPENFKAAFTAAQGWGSYAQSITQSTFRATIALKYGTLKLQTLSTQVPEKMHVRAVRATLNNKPLAAKFDLKENRAIISFAPQLNISAGQNLRIQLS